VFKAVFGPELTNLAPNTAKTALLVSIWTSSGPVSGPVSDSGWALGRLKSNYSCPKLVSELDQNWARTAPKGPFTTKHSTTQ